MKKHLITLSILSSCLYMFSIYTAPACSFKIVNDTGPTIWVVPTPGNPMIRESGSLILREGIPNRLKIAKGQSWSFNGTTFYIYVNQPYGSQPSDAYKLSYKIMVHQCPSKISYSAIKAWNKNVKQFSVQNLGRSQGLQRR